MWDVVQSAPVRDSIQHFTLQRQNVPMRFRDVLRHWQTDERFRMFFSQILADCSFRAFRWETPPVTTSTIDRDFEFVLLKCDTLERPVDRFSFAEHFSTSDVVTIPNLSGDAILVVPCPVADDRCYGHIAAFVRNAPEHQVQAMWKEVARAMTDRLSQTPVWLSTAGMGVSWLHVRLDNRPKYYGHETYREDLCS